MFRVWRIITLPIRWMLFLIVAFVLMFGITFAVIPMAALMSRNTKEFKQVFSEYKEVLQLRKEIIG